MISIIIPVYNVEAYLPQCLDSILAQTYHDFEVILVNDGTPDNSGTICDEYARKDARIRVFHQKNAGVSAARNNGIEQAKGDWITFIDSDDWIDPSYLANFKLEASGDMDLVVQGLEYYNQKDDFFFNPWSFKECILTKEKFRLGFTENRLMEVGFPYGKAYRKRLLDLICLRFDTRISFHEDHIFVLDYYKFCNIIRLVDATDYKYRCYHTGTTLSSKRHPWEKMNLAGEEMRIRFEAMKGQFFLEHSDTERLLYTFAYDCKMTAAESILQGKLSYFEKRKTFKQVVKRLDIRENYFPSVFRSKLVKFIYAYMPYFIVFTSHYFIQLLKKLR